MINVLVYCLIALVFLAEWLVTLGAPRIVSWSPEIISAFAMVVVAIRLGTDRSIVIPQKYIFWFGVMFVLIFAGIVTNTVQSGAVFAGLRTYFRYAPIFLLPIVYHFSDEQIKGQLKFVLIVALLQVPVAVYQYLFRPNLSGDHIVGTVGAPGALSIFLVGTIGMMTAFLVKGKIRLIHYVPIVFLLFIPTAINETTATMLLLPIAFVLPVLLAPTERSRLRLLIPVTLFGALIMTVFISVYNVQYGDRWGGDGGGLGVMLLEGEGLEFLYKGATEENRADGDLSQSEIGRLDSVLMPFKVVSDPVRHWLGNGIGNAATSFNEVFDGDYSEQAAMYGVDFTTAGKLIWEIGIIGLALSFLFLWFVFRDARALSARGDFAGAVALGWGAIIPIVVASMFYRNIVDETVLGYLMWYLSGYVISKRCQQYLGLPEAEEIVPIHSKSRPKMPGVVYRRPGVRPY